MGNANTQHGPISNIHRQPESEAIAEERAQLMKNRWVNNQSMRAQLLIRGVEVYEVFLRIDDRGDERIQIRHLLLRKPVNGDIINLRDTQTWTSHDDIHHGPREWLAMKIQSQSPTAPTVILATIVPDESWGKFAPKGTTHIFCALIDPSRKSFELFDSNGWIGYDAKSGQLYEEFDFMMNWLRMTMFKATGGWRQRRNDSSHPGHNIALDFQTCTGVCDSYVTAFLHLRLVLGLAWDAAIEDLERMNNKIGLSRAVTNDLKGAYFAKNRKRRRSRTKK